MVTIEILQPGDTQEDEPAVKEKIEIGEIQPLHITPVDMKLGSLIPMIQLSDLIGEIKPIEQPQQKEPDRYNAQNIPVYDDGNLSPKKLDLPHHIGLRVVLESVLKKYEKFDDLQIRIS